MERVIQAVVPRAVRRASCLMPRTGHRLLSRVCQGPSQPYDDFSWQARRILAVMSLPLHRALHGRVVEMARDLSAMSPTADHAHAADVLIAALDAGRLKEAASVLKHCYAPRTQASFRIVSDNYRFVWFGVPGVASCSARRKLRLLDPRAELISSESSARARRRCAERTGDYFTFGFIRHPLERLWVCWQTVVASLHSEKFLSHGLSDEMDFPSFCEWVVSPWGADQFAGLHWLSQHHFLTKPDGTVVDFIGTCENIDEDWRTVLEHTGLPPVDLPHLHRSIPLHVEGIESLDSRLLDRLRERYERDYGLGGYSLHHGAPVGF